MSYKYSKGSQVIGDLKAADDAERNTIIDFGEDQIDLQTGGSTRLKISGAAGAVTFNEQYTFPTADGSANQVLQTDGNGQLSFAAAGGGSSPGGPDGALQINDNGSLTGSAGFTFDGSTVFMESTLQVVGEEKLNDSNYSTGEQANRSFTLRRHYNVSLSANTLTDVISFRPYLEGTTNDPTGVLHAAVSYRMEIAGLQNGVANGYRSRKGFISYEGSSAANDFASDTTLGSGPITATVNRSGWVATLQVNANSGGSSGFRGSIFVEIHFPRGGGSNGESIYWSIT
jgi:hypothetical protein